MHLHHYTSPLLSSPILSLLQSLAVHVCIFISLNSLHLISSSSSCKLNHFRILCSLHSLPKTPPLSYIRVVSSTYSEVGPSRTLQQTNFQSATNQLPPRLYRCSQVKPSYRFSASADILTSNIPLSYHLQAMLPYIFVHTTPVSPSIFSQFLNLSFRPLPSFSRGQLTRSIESLLQVSFTCPC